MTELAAIRRRSFASLIPPPRLQLSAWIESNVVLPEGVSALPGKVRLWPYQREIADAISDPEIERVTLIKPVRVGFTTLLTGAIGSFVANEPSPILVLLPTEADARDYIVSDVEPIFQATPVLRGLLSGEQDEGDRNTLLSRRFPGGSLKIVAAKAPRNLRRHTARILIIDESDAMEASAEGSPIKLAERRTLSFGNRKIIQGSTPIFEDTSNVLRSYGESDQRVYEVPCPDCGAMTEIMWAHIEWETDHPKTAAFRCPHCEALIDEKHKASMVAAGAWRATHPEIVGHAGFRLNALISLLTNASWAKLAVEFLQAKEDASQLQTFVNTILGQGWRELGAEVDENSLSARAEDFGLDAIPAAVLFITAGTDVQDDRLETTIIGWSREGIAYVLAHIVIFGSVEDDSTWFELDELLKSRWTHPHGGKIGIDAAAIDSGDSTSKVYSFCFPRIRRRVMAIKGQAGSRPAFVVSKGKIKGGGRLWLLGVDTIKTSLFNKLLKGSSIRFSKSLELSFYEQLASERRVVRYARGQPQRRFERISGRARAEALDCLVYGIAARSAISIQPDARLSELQQVFAASVEHPNVIKSAWMSR